jgi:hypothetical protein
MILRNEPNFPKGAGLPSSLRLRAASVAKGSFRVGEDGGRARDRLVASDDDANAERVRLYAAAKPKR